MTLKLWNAIIEIMRKGSDLICSAESQLNKLLEKHDLMSVVRAHQVQIDGYKMHRWDGESSFPYVVTIFSAPNYCDYYSNKAAVLILKDEKISIKQYDQSEHPYFLPDQIDVFTWSLPFLADKVITMLQSLLVHASPDEDMVDEDLESEAVNKVLETAEKSKKAGVSAKPLTSIDNEDEGQICCKNAQNIQNPKGRK